MPRYEFLCEKCKKPFELIMTISEREKAKPTCPKCKGTKVLPRVGREAARQLGVQLIERKVRSTEELRLSLQEIKPREVQAYFHTPGAMVTSQARLVVDAARVKKLPTMFQETSLTVNGALASYGDNYREIGRLSAKHVQRILAGTNPKDLPVENYDRIELALNLRTAREIGLTIPPSVRFRADKVIE